MNKEGILKHKVVFDAWLKGAEVEHFRNVTSRWSFTATPRWHTHKSYRIRPPQPQSKEMWVNVYKDRMGVLQVSKTKADGVYGCDGLRIACVPVTVVWSEGEGLEGEGLDG